MLDARGTSSSGGGRRVPLELLTMDAYVELSRNTNGVQIFIRQLPIVITYTSS